MGFDDTWADATPDMTGSDDAPPDGKHDAALIDAGAFTSKNGNDVVKLEFQTVDRQFQWSAIYGFNSVKAAGFTKGQCQVVGVNIDQVGSLDELDQALKDHVAGFYEVEVERNGDYVNTYVRDGGKPAVVSDVPADTSDLAPVPAAAGNSDEDLPF